MAETVAAVLEGRADKPNRFDLLARLLDDPHHRIELEDYLEDAVRRESGDVAAKMFDRMRFYAELVEREGKRLRGKEQLDALATMNEQFPRIVEAIDHALNQDDASLLARFAASIAFPLFIQGKLELGASVFNRLLKKAKETGNRSLEVTAGRQYGVFLTEAGKLDEAYKMLLHCLELAQLEENWSALAGVLTALGTVTTKRGQYEESQAFFEQLLEHALKLRDKGRICTALSQLGVLADLQGRLDDAKQLYKESLKIARETGNIYRIAGDLHNLAIVHDWQGEIHEATKLYREALELNRLIGNRNFEARNLSSLGLTAIELGRFDEAKQLFSTCQSIAAETGMKLVYADCERNLGIVAASTENYECARRHLEQAVQLFRPIGAKGWLTTCLEDLVGLYCDLGEYQAAEPLLSEAYANSKEISDPNIAWGVLTKLSQYSLETGKLTEATDYLVQAFNLAADVGSPWAILITLRMAVLLLAKVDKASPATLLACGVSRHLKRIGLVFGKKWHRDLDEAVARCGSLLAPEQLRQLEAQAAAMSIEELTDYALEALAQLQAELGEPPVEESPAPRIVDN